MSNASYADEFRRVVDDVHHTPVTDANPPMILVAFELFASGRPWSMTQRFESADDTG
jgi:hypothetical protein